MDLGQRYHGSKGVPAHKVEDGSLGNLASPGHLEDTASHHINNEVRFTIENYGAKAAPNTTAWVLLFESKLTPRTPAAFLKKLKLVE